MLQALLVIIIALPGCISRDNKLNGYVYCRLNADPVTLDPAMIVDVTGGNIAAKLFNGLVRLDENLNIIPDIAAKWETRDNGITYDFFLKKGILFSNGREVVAEDFRYSFMRICDPDKPSPNSWVFSKIKGIYDYSKKKNTDIVGLKVVGKYHLRITLSAPFSPFIQLLTMPTAYVVPKEEIEMKGRDFSVSPVGTGPYILERWRHNSEVVLKKNELSFIKPRISGLVYRIIPEDLTAQTEFELGNITYFNLPSSEYAWFRNSAKWRDLITSGPGLNTYYLGFNCSRPPFDDVRLRKAVTYAIDRKKIFRTYFEERGLIASGPVPDIIRNWPLTDEFGYDPEKARRMLKDANVRSYKISLYIPMDREVADIAEIIQSYLRDAGLDISIRQLEWSAFKAAVNHGEADMFWLSWWADYPDPENFLFPLFHSSNHGAGGNRTRYTNKGVDSLIEAGQRSTNEATRNHYYSRAERLITDDCPMVFFWHKSEFAVRQKRVKNFKIYPVYSMDKGTDISL